MTKEIWECSLTGELMDEFGNLIDENEDNQIGRAHV